MSDERVGGDLPKSSGTESPEIWRYRRWMVVLILGAFLVLAIVALSLIRSDPASVVDWENYESGLQQRIEQLAASGDCAALEELKAEARASESGQIERTGTGNEDLERYIDSELQGTECAA